MRLSKYTEGQVAFASKQVELGMSVEERLPQDGQQRETYCHWKRRFAGMGVANMRRLKLLEEENRNLEQLVVDVSLEKVLPQDASK